MDGLLGLLKFVAVVLVSSFGGGVLGFAMFGEAGIAAGACLPVALAGSLVIANAAR